MRAIIEAGGVQVPVEVDSKSKIPLIEGEVGQKVDFDKVLFLSGDDKPTVGKPYIDGALVKAEIVGHDRFDKVTVFKFKRRTKYRRTRGHRQDYTEILVKEIVS
ncbi:MAG: 50S ribosomal protein L21 [candidate division Zixibacteria bacterium]